MAGRLTVSKARPLHSNGETLDVEIGVLCAGSFGGMRRLRRMMLSRVKSLVFEDVLPGSDGSSDSAHGACPAERAAGGNTF